MSDPYQIVCSQCNAVNRIPAQRLSEHPLCGQCKQRLFNGHPAELTHNTFAKHINRNTIPVLVDFWAPWCGPCKMMIPVFKHAAEQLEPYIRFAKVNTEDEQILAGQYNIRNIPTLALFKNGVEISRQAGAMSADDLIYWVRAHL